MAVYRAKDILLTTIDDVWKIFGNLTETVNVLYDDNTIKPSKPKEVIFTRYIWNLYRFTPNVPLLYDHTLTCYLETKTYLASTHIRLLELNYRYIIKTLNLRRYEEKEFLLQESYNIVNTIFNDLLFRISPDVATIDATDFIEIINMPEIKEIHANIEPYPDSIEDAYRKINKHLNNTNNKENMFIEAYKSKTIDENQANQCIGPRGFVTDVDRTVYKLPVMNGFIKGLDTIYEVAVESRTAAKSLVTNDKLISPSEYTSRRLQLMAMSVERAVFGDCGSNEYMEFMVKEKYLKNLKGIYYLDEDNILKCIQGNEIHLHDKIIKIRTALGCQLDNPHEVCSTCLGELSLNLPSNSNIGNAFTMRLTKDLTQRLLSTKHITHSVQASVIVLDDLASRYFTAKEDNLYFHHEVNPSTLSIVIGSQQASRLVDVLNLPHNNIAMSKIGDIEEISIINHGKKNNNKENNYNNYKSKETVNITYNDRVCNITREFFDYIKKHNIHSDVKGNFVIDMTHWDSKEPIFNMPLKETSVLKFVKNISSIIETEKDKVIDPYEKLDILFTECSKMFNFNLTILQILIYSGTVFDEDIGNYGLARKSKKMKSSTRDIVMKSRSLSQFYSFQNQVEAIFSGDASIFNPAYRQDHPLDIFFDPVNVLKYDKTKS